MTELRPLKITSNQAVSRLLLESALEDHSAPGAAERALQALSLGVVTATAVTAQAATVRVQAASASSAGGHFAAGLALKWLGLGLVAGAAALLSADRIMLAVTESKRGSAAPAFPTARPSSRITPAVSTLGEPENTPAAVTAERAAEARPLRAVAPAQSAPDLNRAGTEQLQELHAIRRAIADQAPERALSLLERFVARYPTSSLLEEAAVLRFDALLAAGRGEAAAEGQRFLRSYPRSAYAERVRAKLSALP